MLPHFEDKQDPFSSNLVRHLQMGTLGLSPGAVVPRHRQASAVLQAVDRPQSSERVVAKTDHAGTPSYAKSTFSRDAKRVGHQAVDSGGRLQDPRAIPKLLGAVLSKTRKLPEREFKTALMTTISSRRRSIRCAPFRFLDLPSEIRNIVYDFIEREPGMNAINIITRSGPPLYDSTGPTLFIDLKNRRWRETMPPLLRVRNEQLRGEFSSFYFSNRRVEIQVGRGYWQEVQVFRDWIGPENCRLLYENEIAYIACSKSHEGAWRNTVKNLNATFGFSPPELSIARR